MSRLLLLGGGRSGGSSAALWTPAELGANLVGWWKGTSLAGSDGDAKSSWADSSGDGQDATGGGPGLHPLLRTAALNSLNVMEFNGTAYMTLPDFMTAFTAGTVFHVAKLDTDPPASTAVSGPVFKGGTSGSADHYPYDADGLIYHGFGSDTRKSTGYDPSPTFADWHLGCFRSAANDWKFFHNGVQAYTTGTNTVAFPSAPYLGVYNTGLGPNFKGRVAEIVLTDSALSSGDREKLEGYAAHRFGIAAILDAGHPYKAAAPTI